MTEKHYKITVTDKEGDIKLSDTLYQEDIKSVGGIGNFVESIDHFVGDNETLEVGVFYE